MKKNVAKNEGQGSRKKYAELLCDFMFKRLFGSESNKDLLKHMHEMVEIPKEFSDSLFTRLFLLAEIDNFTAEEKEQYYKSLENMGDYYNIIDTAVEEATKRGMAEGVENERLAIAYRMKNLGIDMDLISQVTGLSADEVAALVEEGQR